MSAPSHATRAHTDCCERVSGVVPRVASRGPYRGLPHQSRVECARTRRVARRLHTEHRSTPQEQLQCRPVRGCTRTSPSSILPRSTGTARLASIGEELEAVDWYDQRAEATNNPGLAEVLAHNRDEEKEHAAMTLEWLRRNDPTLDKHLRTYLFTDRSIVSEESEAEHGGGGETSDAAQAVTPGAARRRIAQHREPQGGQLVNHLFRELAPVSDAAWGEIEIEAKRALENFLAARRLVDFTGPHGWTYSASTLGSVEAVKKAPADGVAASLRNVQPVVELKAPFALSAPSSTRSTGATSHPSSVRSSTRRARLPRPRTTRCSRATTPRRSRGSRRRLRTRRSRSVTASVSTPRGWPWPSPCCVTRGSRARTASHSGRAATPASSRRPRTAATRSSSACASSSVARSSTHRRSTARSCCRCAATTSSCRRGQDVSIGFDSADETEVHLYLEESFAFHAHSPEAAVALKYPA